MPELKSENPERNLKTHLAELNDLKGDLCKSSTAIEGRGPPASMLSKKSENYNNNANGNR